MKVHYDKEVDALYIKLSNQKPDGVIEIAEGVNIDTTIDGGLTVSGVREDWRRGMNRVAYAIF